MNDYETDSTYYVRFKQIARWRGRWWELGEVVPVTAPEFESPELRRIAEPVPPPKVRASTAA